MWNRETVWFDLATILAVFAVGGVLFGRFEQHKPRARRVLKVVMVSAFYVVLAQSAGRPWAYGVLAFFGSVAAYVHLRWLPQRGINGWTAEPYDKYLELMTRRAGGDRDAG